MTHRGTGRPAKPPGASAKRYGDLPFIADLSVPLVDRLRYQAQRHRNRKQQEIADLLSEAANAVVASSHQDHRNDAAYI